MGCGVSECVGLNVTLDAIVIISETSLSRKLIALVTDNQKQKKNKYASYLDWRIYAIYADRGHRPVCHTWYATAQPVRHVDNDSAMRYRFFTFWPWGLTPADPWAKVYQTWRRPAAGTSPPSRKISAR